MKQPQVGQKITTTHGLNNVASSGVVRELLATQFTYETDRGQIRFCFYSDEWRTL